MQRQFGFTHCDLLNDLEATACGLPALGADDLLTLQEGGDAACGNVAVIAAGTGLGEAGLYWDGRQHQPFATEGGHASFAPSNTQEFALLRHMQQQFGHVSWGSHAGVTFYMYDCMRGLPQSCSPGLAG